jgi:MATE family multidrug resistance protein
MAFGRLGITNQAANQIALSLASFTFMAMGLKCCSNHGWESETLEIQLQFRNFSIFLLAILL